jgi:hypothetical protein
VLQDLKRQKLLVKDELFLAEAGLERHRLQPVSA